MSKFEISQKKSWAVLGVYILFVILSLFILINLSSNYKNDYIYLLFQVTTIGSTYFIFAYTRRKKYGKPKFNFNPTSLKIILLAVLVNIAIIFSITIPVVSFIPTPDFNEKILANTSVDPNFVFFLSIVILAPLIEELLFRGYILEGLLAKYSYKKAILISSLLFAIAHLNIWQFPGTFIGGILLGWLYYKTRSLALVMILHASNNFFVFIQLLIQNNQVNKTSTTPFFSNNLFEILIIAILAIVLLYFSLQFLLIELNKRTNYKWK